ncbi:alpha-(1,3)-fucosyltransferase C-like [Ornithodoros turicata]|uniref:alpha-(1,3)-fucosyltransferase C-like n=1 Tax=Ornithodoros turicata TaxID=34597 RepID=UPI003138EECD
MNATQWVVWILLLALLTTVFIYNYTSTYPVLVVPSHRKQNNGKLLPWYNRTSSVNASDIPRILLWTSFFNSRVLGLSPEDDVELPNCHHRCHVTYNRNLLSSSDAVVFHSRDMNLNDIPSRRAPEQKWVFWCMEPPPYSFYGGFEYIVSMFNWTMTYRTNSDIPIAYGMFKSKNTGKEERPDIKKSWETKSKSAVWVVSHCNTDSRREAFVRELRQHIDVDVFGLCGLLKCPQDSNNTCFRRFVKEYYFVLALENSLCRDYVTEKLFSALQHVIVPVAMGSVNYSAITPPHSVIDVSSFDSPKELAGYLHRVKKDFELYKEYLEWKNKYVVQSWVETFCSLCEKLHGEDFRTYSVYDDMLSWWVTDSKCYRWNDDHWRALRKGAKST